MLKSGKEIIISAIIAFLIFMSLSAVLSLLLGCKPSMPVRADYTEDMYPCYLAEVCLTINAYMEKNKTDCGLALQKCYRYADYKRCEAADEPDDCFSKLGIRI